MGTVTGYTAERMQEIEDTSVVDGNVDGSGHLILVQHNGTEIDAGLVKGVDGTDGTDGTDGDDGAPGPAASIGTTPPASPVTGQIWYDTNNLTGLTDLMAAANPVSSTANWVALGFGYATSVTFSIAGGGCTHTYSSGGNHLGAIALGSLTPGNAYLAIAKLYVPTGSPDVQLATGFKSSGVKTTVKNQDVTIVMAFTADDTGAYFGIETPAGTGTGTCVVKSFSVYAVNQKGFPGYIYNGTEWEMLSDISAKGDQYSRVNTYGAQIIAGAKTWTGAQVIAPATDVVPLILKRGADPGGAVPKIFDMQNHAGSSLAYFDYNGNLSTNSAAANYLTAAVLADLATIRAATCIDISSTNLNSLAYVGWFRGSTLTNSPDGTTGTFYIESLIIDSNTAVQRAVKSSTAPLIWVRTKLSGTWGSWKLIYEELPAIANGYQGSNATAASTSYAALSPGLEVSFVVAQSGSVMVTIFNDISMSGTAAGCGSFEIRTAASGGGSVSLAADDGRSNIFNGAAARISAAGAPLLVTGLTPGTTYYARTMSRNGTGTGAATFNVRRLLVQPVAS